MSETYTVYPNVIYSDPDVILIIFDQFKLKQTASDPVRTFYHDNLGRTWIEQNHSLLLLA